MQSGFELKEVFHWELVKLTKADLVTVYPFRILGAFIRKIIYVLFNSLLI